MTVLQVTQLGGSSGVGFWFRHWLPVLRYLRFPCGSPLVWVSHPKLANAKFKIHHFAGARGDERYAVSQPNKLRRCITACAGLGANAGPAVITLCQCLQYGSRQPLPKGQPCQCFVPECGVLCCLKSAWCRSFTMDRNEPGMRSEADNTTYRRVFTRLSSLQVT